jgi:hypothetical protein
MRVAYVISLASVASHTAAQNIGYYTDLNEFVTDPAAGIIANGATPIQILDIDTFDFNTIDMLIVNESSNGPPSADMTAALGAIDAWVQGGGLFVVHDRFVSNGGLENNPFFIGAPGMLAMRDFTDDANIDILDGSTKVTNGIGGVLDNASLDGGTSSSHGFVDGTTLPGSALAILSRTNANDVVSLSYLYGDGAVFYSTIPLDFYLAGNGPNPPQGNMADIYYPNVIDYMLTIPAPATLGLLGIAGIAAARRRR